MEIGGLRIDRVNFPGRAGELQRQEATASLVRELGDNYGTYHAYLAGELGKVGRPQRDDFDSMDAYLEAWAVAQDLVRAEVVLRNCRAYRRTGRDLRAPLQFDVPLVRDDRLVGLE
jgi:hypothetical protein